MDAHVRGDGLELAQVGADLPGAQGAVDAHAEGAGVGHGGPEGVHGHAEQGPGVARLGEGHGDHQRQLLAGLVEDVQAGQDGRLGVEHVEDGLHQQQVAAALDQAARRLHVGGVELVEGDLPGGRVVHVPGAGERLVGGAQGAGHEARAVGRALAPGVGGLPGQARAFAVDLAAHVLQPVVRLGDAVGAEGVGDGDVGPRLEVGVVGLGDELRPGQADQLVVALEIKRVVAESLAAEVRLGQPPVLEPGAHGAVDHQDALGRQRLQAAASGSAVCGHGRKSPRGPIGLQRPQLSSIITVSQCMDE